MKAIVVREFGGPEVLKVEVVPDPRPGPGQVIVRNRAIGVNPVETYVRTGKYPVLPELPYTPGMDSAGEIEAVGEGVADLKPGDRVYFYGNKTGAYAEKTLAEAWQVHRLPERASFEQGAAIGVPVGAAWRALFVRGDAKAGEVVLVHGATGTVGISAVQLARAAGLTVIGTGGGEGGKRKALEAGAHFAATHDAYDEIKSYTPGGKGVSLVLEMLANKNLVDDLKVLARHGRVVVIGSRGPIDGFDPRLTMTTELDIRGVGLPNATKEEQITMHQALVAALESGVLQPVIGPQFSLEDAPKAHEAVMSGETQGKITLAP